MISIFNKNKILVTHDGSFHTDDLFATATLSILHKGKIKIIRSHEKDVIAKADYVYDVGGIYDKEKGLFDHHQKDGPIRDNGIPYASFGLVWKEFGEKICGNKEVSTLIENKIVLPIDAEDNGVDLFKTIYDGISPYSVGDIFKSEIPTWRESSNEIDKIFKKQVKKIIVLLKREIQIAKDDVLGIQIVKEAYEESQDKRIIKLKNNLPRYLYQNVLASFEEPMYVLIPGKKGGKWNTEAIRQNLNTKASRKPFPERWRGETDINKLRELSGVKDVIFCHRSGFLVGAESENGAMELAQKSLAFV